jgi:hypothetical protein
MVFGSWCSVGDLHLHEGLFTFRLACELLPTRQAPNSSAQLIQQRHPSDMRPLGGLFERCIG